jgi:hypothetical protein
MSSKLQNVRRTPSNFPYPQNFNVTKKTRPKLLACSSQGALPCPKTRRLADLSGPKTKTSSLPDSVRIQVQ